jgi:hypothetical protein
VAAAVAVPVLWGGGFSAASRVAFSLLAAGALVEAVRVDPRACAAAARHPVALALAGLAAAGAVSAAWSLAGPADTLRWALVVAGYGALLVAAAALSGRPGGAAFLATVLCACAAAAAAAGLVGVVARSQPLAYRVGGSWLAAGTLEYPAGLALLQVCALPALLRGMQGDRGWATGLAGLCAGMSMCVLALSGSRLAVALAALVAATTIAVPSLARCRRRREAAMAAAVLALAAAAAALALGGYAAPRAQGGGGTRLLAVIAIPAILAAAWPRLRALSRSRSRRADRAPARFPTALALAAAAALVAAGLLLAAAERPSGPAVEASGGFDAGRHIQWEAALDAFGEAPLKGWGSDSYLPASAPYQGAAPVRYAHDLPLEAAAELGILGGALALALYLGAGLAAWRSRGSLAGWLFGPAALAFLLANLVDWPWHLAGLGAVWAASMGAVIRAGEETGRY